MSIVLSMVNMVVVLSRGRRTNRSHPDNELQVAETRTTSVRDCSQLLEQLRVEKSDAYTPANARGDEKKATEAAERLATCAIKAGADPSAMVDKMKSIQ
jgi:hypothetical protein